MSTVSTRRPPVRPKPIRAFLDEVLELYRANHTTTYYELRRLDAFLAGCPGVETTEDLTLAIVEGFAGTLGDLHEKARLRTLLSFRRACRLAVESGCLERDPFEDYRLPKRPRRTQAPVPVGPRLDAGQVRRLMQYLEGRADTWQGHRLHAFAGVILYTRIQTAEALRLTVEDCDLVGGVIRIQGRYRRMSPTAPREVPIPRDLARILEGWLPRRRQASPALAFKVRYGMRMAEDGRSLVPDPVERAIIAEMVRLRGEGWTYGRIAGELDRREVPTRRGGKWEQCTVGVILKREGQPGATAANIGRSPAADGTKVAPDWLFPNVVGPSNWGKAGPAGYTALEQLREAGKALGIEGLTVESLRRFHGEHSRRTLDFPGADFAPAESEPVPPAGDGPEAELAKLTPKQALVVRSLIEAGPEGLTGATLGVVSRVPSWRKILRELKKDSPYWYARIFPPGRGKTHYRINML